MSSVYFSGPAAAPETSPLNPKLQSAAHEFEASLMKEFLKPLQHDSLFADDASNGEDNTSGSAEALMSYGAEAMAKAISEHGGFGIAKKILDHFKATDNGPTNWR
jgi:Rod binding domain-containing protein